MSETTVLSCSSPSGVFEAQPRRANEAEIAPHVRRVAAGPSQRPPLHREESNNRGRERQRANSISTPSTSAVRPGMVYSSTAEAIANFRPTSRQVISGIAPHVFDERKRRRSTQHRSRSPKPYWHPRQTEKKSSPLRVTTSRISFDDYSIYLEQSDAKFDGSTDALSVSSVTVSKAASIHVVEDVENRSPSRPSNAKRQSKTGWRYLVDIRSLRTVVDKLKLPISQSHQSAIKVKA